MKRTRYLEQTTVFCEYIAVLRLVRIFQGSPNLPSHFFKSVRSPTFQEFRQRAQDVCIHFCMTSDMGHVILEAKRHSLNVGKDRILQDVRVRGGYETLEGRKIFLSLFLQEIWLLHVL